MPARLRALALAAAASAALALAGCGGGDGGGGDDQPAKDEPAGVTKNEGDARLLRTAADTYRQEVIRSVAAVRSGLTQGDYDDDLNKDVYALRGAIYRFDQALRRIAFVSAAEGRVNEILSSNSAAISQLDPIIDASRWPASTEKRVKRVLENVDLTLDEVDALVARL
jgi:hypothetical protein